MKNHHKKVSENRKLLLCTVLGKASTHTDNLVVLYVISNNYIHLHTNYIITYKSYIQLHFQRVDGKFENICIDMFFKF